MKRMMRLLLVEVVVVGALAAWGPAAALATDARPTATAASVAPPASTMTVKSANSAIAAAKPSPTVPPPGVWTVLPAARAAADANPDSGSHPATASETQKTSVAEARADAPSPGATSQPAAVHPATSSPAIAAISPPGGFPSGTVNQPAASGTTKSTAASSAAKHAPAAPIETPGEIALAKTKDPWVLNDPRNWAVMVFKSRHELVVYFEGHLYKKYRAVFGRSLKLGTKEWAGDRRTPLGVYRIVSKRPDRRWRYFLKLNYPNRYDRRVYETMLSEGEVPRVHGRPIPEGGDIGIHGTDEPMLNSGDINWTTGCISVNNASIDELDALLPVGTLVIIKR